MIPTLRRAAHALPTLALAFVGVKLVTLLVNLVTFPTLRARPAAASHDAAAPRDAAHDAASPHDAAHEAAAARDAAPPRAGAAATLAPAPRRPRVALLVPMRNEADRLPGTLPGLLDTLATSSSLHLGRGADEVLFLDDCSDDGSADLVRAAADARRAAAAGPGAEIRVLAGSAPPAGWAGKTWACQQLGKATDADVLVFCDADVFLGAGAVGAVLDALDDQDADVVSVFPRQRTGGWSERLLVPLIDDVLLCWLPFPLLRATGPGTASAATANGSVLAFRRDAYDRLGGFDGVRDAVVEDVALARLVRRRGLRLGLALGGDHVQTRMYASHEQTVAGLGRGLVPVAGSRRAVVVGWLWHVVVYSWAALAAPFSPRWRAVALLGVAGRVLVEAKTGRRGWLDAVAVGAAPLAAAPVVRQALRPEQRWKGRRVA